MDAGGKIRSANILKNLKGGAFRTRLLAPATADEEARWGAEMATLADEVAVWRPAPTSALRRLSMGQGPVCAVSPATSTMKPWAV